MRFGVPAQVVVEIVRAVAVTPISGAPAVVQGLIDYRGTIVPVFDVGRPFTEVARVIRASHAFIVADTPRRRAALHVDSVEGLIEIEGAAVESPVAQASDLPIAGVARTADGLVILHDLARVLSDAEQWALDRAIRQRNAAQAVG
jgi:purine-binding chemotaxis protein CheW